MRNKEIVEKTTNRTVFNRAYKEQLAITGKIYCSFCKYHHGENFDGDIFGGYKSITYPNWKLVSKNRKQYMEKRITVTTTILRHGAEYTEIKF